jgi:hypothetical protein
MCALPQGGCRVRLQGGADRVAREWEGPKPHLGCVREIYCRLHEAHMQQLNPCALLS